MNEQTQSTITPAQLKQLMAEKSDVRLLDVRTGGEYESVHIPGSYNVPLDTFGEHAGRLATVEYPVVLVCQSGARADKACQRLTSAGKTTLTVLDGGIQGWQQAGGDVVAGTSSRWAMDRQVRFVAGGLVFLALVASVVFPWAKWIAGAVGFGLVFSAVTDTCAMGTVLSKLPYNRASGSTAAAVGNAVAQLSQPSAA
jgi:rhodanese-related sulfurtransferase